MPRPWKRPTLPPSPLGELNRALHELHHRAGWPSSRQIRRALEDKGVFMSHTKVHDTLTKPVLPTKGAVEMITEVLAEAIRGTDVSTEIDRILGLWDKASFDIQAPTSATSKSSTVEVPALAEAPPTEEQVDTEQKWREKAETGDPEAMHHLGALLRRRGELEEAAVWYRRAAAANHTEAMVQLGDLLEQREAYQEALTWYRTAADAGHPDAMYYIGSLLQDRGPREAAKESAMYWFQRAAHAGQAEAASYLGWQLEGQGKYREALSWYRRAAQPGESEAMYELGALLYKLGEREEAETWLRRAAQAGVTDAMRALSKALRARGIYKEADMWELRAQD